MADIWAAEMQHAIGPGFMSDTSDDDEMVTLWSTDITVGTAANSDDPIQVCTGYFPPGDEYQGELNDSAFTVDGLDRNVNAIFEQQFGDSFRQLVFEAGERLPDNLILQVGDNRFRVSGSGKLGIRGNIHAWTLEESLGWDEGATMPALIELPEPDPGPGPICNTVTLQ